MKIITCVVCPKGCQITAQQDGALSAYQCERGEQYARAELTRPVRNISSTVCISGARYARVPVKTDRPIDKSLIFEAMNVLRGVSIASPVKIGDIVVADVLGTGVNFVVTRNL